MEKFLVPTLLEWKQRNAARQDADESANEDDGDDEDGGSAGDGTSASDTSGNNSESEDGEGSSGGRDLGAEPRLLAGDDEGATVVDQK